MPRWIILFIDITISLVSIVTAFFLRFNFNLPSNYLDSSNLRSLYYVIPIFLLVRLISFILSRTYAGIIRHTSTKDAARIFTVLSLGSVSIVVANFIGYYFIHSFFVPLSVIVIEFFTSVFIMTASRFIVKAVYLEYLNDHIEQENVIIYGSGGHAVTAKRTLSQEGKTGLNVVAFIDQNKDLAGKKLDGINIYKASKLEELIHKLNISVLIIAEKELKPILKNEIIEICLNSKVKVQTLPDVKEWINGELSFKQIRKVKIEDLLERKPISLDDKQIKKDTINKIVLVTGAAGSIGSEIVKQLTRFKPHKILILDQAESPLYDLELELSEKFSFQNYQVLIADVTNKKRLEEIFNQYKPSIIYHAAAYKHVPMMENNPKEAIATNVLGTKNVADLAVKYGTNKFVMVSTDKAVNPTNVMGASKRIAEIYTQSLNRHTKTKFITTRFGNVLGSNGSVIPRFRNQIEKGGPVTVTHPDITRYFMTIPEACQLVLEAGAQGEGGEIFIFDMGSSVKIVDLAKKMIRLSGLELGKDIQLNYTGLRPGEKLYEELLNSKENTIPTHHSKIMVAKVREYQLNDVIEAMTNFKDILKSKENDFAIVRYMKKIVPEFISKNSIYEELDHEYEIQELNGRNGKDQKINGEKLLSA